MLAEPPPRLWRREALLAGLVLALPRVAHADPCADTETDAQARWLAGTVPLAHSAGDDEWVAYAESQDRRWDLTLPRVRAMQSWSARELSGLLPAGRAVVYPFAGPDALHALALFGEATRLILIGLEPVGELPDPARHAGGYFTRLDGALLDVHRLTFFRTHAMASAFALEGVLPALLSTLVRMGGRVAAVRRTSNPDAVRIDWVSDAGDARRLDYIQVDLANAGLGHTPRLVAGLRELAPYVTFLKAASYLLAEPRFSSVRTVLLEESDVLVQDDSGVPFHHLASGWALRLFGRYETPASPFEDRLQPDLQAAYASRAPRALPFGIGYHVEAKSSNLLVAARVRS